jgi:O-antigen ligase
MTEGVTRPHGDAVPDHDDATAPDEPRRAELILTGAALWLAVGQIYLLPKGTIDVPLSFAVTVAMVPLAVLGLRRDPRLLRTPLFLSVVALLFMRLLAVAWSPEPRDALRPVMVLGQFVVILLVFHRIIRRDPRFVTRLRWLYWPWVVAEIVLVLAFRLLPDLEDAYLHSIGGVFAGHNAVAALYGDNPNNVLDPAKSGGVFINANVAAIFLGVNGFAALALAARTGSRRLRWLGAAALLTVPVTGSKLATILVVVLVAAAVLGHRFGPVVRRHWKAALAGAAAVVVGVVVVLRIVEFSFVDALERALDQRVEIWGFVPKAVSEHTVLGLGYGGWEREFAVYAREHGIPERFPPHNMYIAEWATGGVAALIILVLYVGALGRLLSRAARVSAHRAFVWYTGAAIAWIMVQGMAENTSFYGEVQLIPIVSVLICFLTADAEGKDRQ